MIKCAIIDDEPLAIQLLSDYAEKSNDLKLISTYTDPIEALHDLENKGVELIFLDIQMSELTGLQFMKIAKQKYQFILTTAYERYALESYDFDVIDYLLKPIAFDRFLNAVEKAKARMAETPPASVQVTNPNPSNFMFVKTGYKVQKVDYDSIFYFEGLGDYVAIHLQEGKILTLEKMKQFEAELPLERFARVHKSYIVAIDKIEFIERNRIQIREKLIPISASYTDAFWARIGK